MPTLQIRTLRFTQCAGSRAISPVQLWIDPAHWPNLVHRAMSSSSLCLWEPWQLTLRPNFQSHEDPYLSHIMWAHPYVNQLVWGMGGGVVRWRFYVKKKKCSRLNHLVHPHCFHFKCLQVCWIAISPFKAGELFMLSVLMHWVLREAPNLSLI